MSVYFFSLGDSGGPAIVKENRRSVQIGVVSWGKGCADSRFPGGFYVNLELYLDWIRRNTDGEELLSYNCTKL